MKLYDLHTHSTTSKDTESKSAIIEAVFQANSK